MGETGDTREVVSTLGVWENESRLLDSDMALSSIGVILEIEFVRVFVRLRERFASSEPTSLPYVWVVRLVATPMLLHSSCRDLIFCHVFSLLPTEPSSKALMNRELWSMPKRTSPVISWSRKTSQCDFSTPTVNKYSATSSADQAPTSERLCMPSSSSSVSSP